MNRAAAELGIDHHTLADRLKKIGLDPRKGRTFHTREIIRAHIGDLEFEKILETRARREGQERANAEAAGDLVRLDEAQKLINDALAPVRQALNSLASEVANRCNPSDVPLARAALQRWVDDKLPFIRAHLPSANGSHPTHDDPGLKSSGSSDLDGTSSQKPTLSGRATATSRSKAVARPSRKGKPRKTKTATTA